MTATKTKSKPKTTVADRIAHLDPCMEAIKWARGYTSPSKAWRECRRGDWMLFYAGKCSGPPESEGRKRLVLAACECARLALPRYEKRYPKDNRVRNCIDVAERWAKGQATIAELREARAADAAAYAAAAAAAYAAYAADARATMLAACADIVRKFYPAHPEEKSA